MAVISQAVYWRAIGSKKKYSIDLSLVIYSYLYYGIVFSFYSNRFFSALSPDFFKFLLSLYALRWYLTKLKLKVKGASKVSARGVQNV